MNIPRFLAVCAVLAAFAAFPSRAPAEEDENTEEAAAQEADQAPTTTTTTTEAAAPAAEPIPVKKAARGYKNHPRPAAARRDEGGGGGGGGALPRRPGAGDEEEDDQSSSPTPPLGKPPKDDKGCDMPPLHHINVHLMGGNGNRFRVDSTPIVCSTDAGTRHERYCQETMGDDNRRCCPVKPEGHPLRVACELILLGTDPTDGIAGPHWSYAGGDGRVERHPDNPFLAFAYGKGVVRACSNVSKACGETSYQVPNYKP
ncbi:MAG: hypothetical protein HYV14_09650 [Elusimicrobia bacterium]|nr:hypothetical protein [Elusimicrobiota bacterium]